MQADMAGTCRAFEETTLTAESTVGKVQSKSAGKQLDTHPLNSLDFHVDLSHVSTNNLVVLHQVHPQQMIMDQPQHHVTCEPGHHFSQLRNLAGRGRVQFLPGVQHCAKVLVLLEGKTKVF